MVIIHTNTSLLGTLLLLISNILSIGINLINRMNNYAVIDNINKCSIKYVFIVLLLSSIVASISNTFFKLSQFNSINSNFITNGGIELNLFNIIEW